MEYETIKQCYELEDSVQYTLKGILSEVADMSCPNSYGFEGPGTFSDCGECIVCLSKKFMEEYNNPKTTEG